MQETRRRRRRLLGPVAAAAVLVLALPPASPGAPPAAGGYQENDFGGFRNVLPPGQNGFATGAQISEFLFGGGARPPHNDDQLGMYGDLVYASPGLGAAQLDEFFKDASFGVQASDVDRTYTPACAVTSAPSPSSAACDDVTIVRDKGFAVPHVYGADRAGLTFGLGYVTGEDRLFAADIQRNTGRAQLSSFLGGSQAEMDRGQWLQTPYTEADWQRQFDQLDDLYGADGAQVQADVRNYVDGINQYIAEARVDSDKMPGEYGFLGRPEGPAPWTVTDVGATASLVAGIFGKGGGREVDSALVLEEAKKRFGGSKGKRVWNDFRSAEDPEAPVTAAGRKFPYLAVPRKPKGEALPDPGTVKEEDVVVAASGSRGEAGSARFGRIDLLGSASGMSNALLVSAEESADGKPLAVMGPQVGYFTPEVLMEVDAHAPGGPAGPPIDARGATFAGVSFYVQLGRGRDFAWSATSAGQDIIDTFAVELCEPGGSRSTLDSMH